MCKNARTERPDREESAAAGRSEAFDGLRIGPLRRGRIDQRGEEAVVPSAPGLRRTLKVPLHTRGIARGVGAGGIVHRALVELFREGVGPVIGERRALRSCDLVITL